MKIQSINFNNLSYKTQKQPQKKQEATFEHQKYSNIPFCAINARFIEIKSKMEKEKIFCKDFLQKEGKITLKQYHDVVKNHPYTITASSYICEETIKANEFYTTPELCGKIAVELKKYYDEIYENYTIVSIGTSPSPITEVMELLGVEVIYLPISGLRELDEKGLPFFRQQYPTIASRQPRIKNLMEYATKKGISKKSKGALVVLDYTSSGKSLRTMCKVLEERGDIDSNRIKKHSLDDDVKKISETSGRITKKESEMLLCDLAYSRYEKISNTPHFYYNEKYLDDPYLEKSKRELFRGFDDFSQKEARAWVLYATYEAMNLLKGEKNENSIN